MLKAGQVVISAVVKKANGIEEEVSQRRVQRVRACGGFSAKQRVWVDNSEWLLLPGGHIPESGEPTKTEGALTYSSVHFEIEEPGGGWILGT